jgi:hypothetical protein
MAFNGDQAANLVSIHANETLKFANSHINFNNTATINVKMFESGYSSTANLNTVNVEFNVNTSAVVFVGPTGNTGPQGIPGNTGNTGPAGSAPSKIIPTTYITSNVRLNVFASGVASNTYLVSAFVPANTIVANTIASITAGLVLYHGFSNQPGFGINFLPEVDFEIFWGANGNSSDPVIFNSKIFNQFVSGDGSQGGSMVDPTSISQQLLLIFSDSGNSVVTHLMSGVTTVGPGFGIASGSVIYGNTSIQPVFANTIDTSVDNYLGFGVNVISNVSPTIVSNAIANIVSTIITQI